MSLIILIKSESVSMLSILKPQVTVHLRARKRQMRKKAVGSWVTLEQTEVTVPAHDTVKVPFEIQIPEKADAGEQNGCIVVQDTSTDAKQQSGGVVLNFHSAIRIAITIPN